MPNELETQQGDNEALAGALGAVETWWINEGKLRWGANFGGFHVVEPDCMVALRDLLRRRKEAAAPKP